MDEGGFGRGLDEFQHVTVGNWVWRVRRRYSGLTTIVQSDTGNTVCGALDEVEQKRVAIKRLDNALHDVHCARKALRELELLQFCASSDLVVGIQDAFCNPDHPLMMNSLYFVLEFVDSDLNQYLKYFSSEEGALLPVEHVQLIFYQLLCGLKYLHSANIVHRDLRPSNIGLTNNCEVKILDLGFSRALSNEDMTIHVTAANYRAPEVVLFPGSYSHSVDVWSAGCILAELLTVSASSGRYPLFRLPHDNPLQLFDQIFALLGAPDEQFMRTIPNKHVRECVQKRAKDPRFSKPTSEILPNCDPEGSDLALKLLVFDPSARVSIEQALAHPFLRMVHDPESEQPCEQTFNSRASEDTQVSMEGLKEHIWNEIQRFSDGPKIV